MAGLLQVKDADQPQHQLHRQQTAGPSYCVVLQPFVHAANVFRCSASFVLAVGHRHLQRFWLGMLLPQACLAPHHILPVITSPFLCKKNTFFSEVVAKKAHMAVKCNL